jgi:FMN-dependent NADH-azoreductase
VNILRIDASARYQDSVSRQLTDELIARLKQQDTDAQIVVRDLAKGVPLINEEMVVAYNTPVAERTARQQTYSSSQMNW